jgi:hypothetical protein
MLAFSAFPSAAQVLFSSPEVKASTTLDTNKILVGQQTNLHLQITAPSDINVQWPELSDTITANIEIIRTSDIDTLATEKEGILQLSKTISISSFDSGYYAIPPFYFIYGKANDSIRDTVETNALLLEVHNVKVDFKAKIKDIKPIIDEPWTFAEILPYILIALAIIILIILGIYIYQRRKQNKPIFTLPKKPKIPAHIIALQKLDKLKEQKLWQTGSSKEFYSELTDILRAYMEGRMQFGAMEMISDDIIAELQKQHIESTLLTETQNVLQTADLVKFAKVEPLADENDRALKWGYSFVKSTMPVEEKEQAENKNKSIVEPSKNNKQ